MIAHILVITLFWAVLAIAVASIVLTLKGE